MTDVRSLLVYVDIYTLSATVFSTQPARGKARGIPHLAKNERDMGHPAIGDGIEPKAHSLALGLRPLRDDNGRSTLGFFFDGE